MNNEELTLFHTEDGERLRCILLPKVFNIFKKQALGNEKGDVYIEEKNNQSGIKAGSFNAV